MARSRGSACGYCASGRPGWPRPAAFAGSSSAPTHRLAAWTAAPAACRSTSGSGCPGPGESPPRAPVGGRPAAGSNWRAQPASSARRPPAASPGVPLRGRAPRWRTRPTAGARCPPRRHRPGTPAPTVAAWPGAGWGTSVRGWVDATAPPAWPARPRAAPSSGSTCAARCWWLGRSGRAGPGIPGGRSRRRPDRTRPASRGGRACAIGDSRVKLCPAAVAPRNP
ncbi:hypothetical protein D3C71_1317660 [compost metagenome]